MAEPICEDDGLLQEWFPETRLLQQIPLRVQRGLFSHNLTLTCVDAVSEYIALGTNCGLIYWYCRATNELQRLRFENSNNTVTCVKIVSTVDYMVAGGTDHGNLTVFQIPKVLPDSIPSSLKPKKNQVERFTINGLHNAPVTNIEWSQNGMKLFSGDRNGLVVLTEIDFYMHLSKSIELLNEQFEIVQLSYNQQTLLISTTFRSIICDGLDKWKVHQVGTKERKILGKYGATFCKLDQRTVIYASRPGHRLWLANKGGTVQQTLLFKSAIPSSYPKIQLLNPVNKLESCDNGFGKLLQFGGDKLIAYNSEIMYVLHPGAISVVSSLDSARRIIDLAVGDDEIFILEGERSLLRLGYEPDKYYDSAAAEGTSRRKSFILDELASRLKDTAMESIKKITSELIITPERESPNSPPTIADEALNLPPIVPLPPGSISSIVPEEDIEVHLSVDASEFRDPGTASSVGRRGGDVESQSGPCARCPDDAAKMKECEDVISRPLRRRNPKRNKLLTVMQGQESESDTTSNASEDRLVWGVAKDLSMSEESGISFSQSQSSFSILRDIPTLLTANAMKTVKSESMQDGGSSKAGEDDKSQASLDTCESASENLRLTPERFLEEQEKTFYRLANQEISLLDSYNSEKTDNMSISLNMTPSSSVSSKISENAQSTSEVSENVSMVSETKTENSPSTNNSQNDSLPLPKHPCFCAYYSNAQQGSTSSQEDKRTISASYSGCSKNSQYASDHFAAAKDDGSDHRGEDWEATDVVVDKDLVEVEVGAGDGTISMSLGELMAHEEEMRDGVGSNGDVRLVTGRDDEEGAGDDEEGAGDDSRVKTFLDSLGSGNADEGDLPKQGDLPCKAEPLSYGPPSGSSTLDRNPSSDFSFSNNFASSLEPTTEWMQCQTCGLITCLAVGNNYVAFVDTSERVYFSGLSEQPLSWSLLAHKAALISFSNNDNLLWMLRKNDLFAVVFPAKKVPVSDAVEHRSNVGFFAADSAGPEVWIVETNGQVKRQQSPTGNAENVPCNWRISSVACLNGLLLATTAEDTLICKLPNEERFRSVTTPKGNAKCVALGPEDAAWIVDDANNVYFSDDFLTDEPRWWQITIGECVHQNPSAQNANHKMQNAGPGGGSQGDGRNTVVVANENSVWVFDKLSNVVRVNKSAVTGYIWNKIDLGLSVPVMRWIAICANGVFENKGHLWLLDNCGILFCSKPSSKHFQSVSPPCEDIRCISSSTDAFWVLSSNGRLYSRLGLNNGNLVGSSWKELHLPESDKFQLAWISCGCDVTWGCDIRGRIFVTIASPFHVATNIFDSAWLEVEGEPKEGTKFEKVFVGPSLHMVWAIDNEHNVYVREGIFPHYQVGTSWVFVSGLQATVITISSTSVWALSPDGCIYRRCGISESNYIGDYWKRIPGALRFVTSSFTDELWGIDRSNAVVQLDRKTKMLDAKKRRSSASGPESASSNGANYSERLNGGTWT